jgi:hypothetical protein
MDKSQTAMNKDYSRSICAVLCTILLTGLGVAASMAQENAGFGYMVRGIYSYPTDPEIFNDYWSWGWGAGVGITYPLGKSFELSATADYARFNFDIDRLNLYVQLPSTETAVSGAVTSTVTVAIQLKYPRKPRGIFPIFAEAGIGFEHSGISGGTVQYADLKYNEPPRGSSGLVLIPGVGLQYSFTDALSCFMEARYCSALSSSNQFNSNQIPLSFGFRSSL